MWNFKALFLTGNLLNTLLFNNCFVYVVWFLFSSMLRTISYIFSQEWCYSLLCYTLSFQNLSPWNYAKLLVLFNMCDYLKDGYTLKPHYLNRVQMGLIWGTRSYFSLQWCRGLLLTLAFIEPPKRLIDWCPCRQQPMDWLTEQLVPKPSRSQRDRLHPEETWLKCPSILKFTTSAWIDH